MFKSKQFIIGIIISLIFLGWALYNEQLDKVWESLTKAQYWALLPALALYFTGVWVRAVRWRTLLKPIVPKIGLMDTFKVVVIGYMANDVLPARIGELVRAYVLSIRTGVRKTATLATIFVERVFDGLTMLGFAAAVIIFIIFWDRDALMTGIDHKLGNLLTSLDLPIIIASVIFLGLLLIFIAVASSRTRAERAIAFFLRFMPGKLHERGERLATSFVDGLGSLRSASSMATVLVLSLIAWLFETGMYYTLGTWGFDLRGGDGQPLPFYAYMLATSFANLSTLIPQAPGFIGVFDWIAKVVLVGAFGVVGDLGISYVLVLHAALLIPVTLLGFVYLWRESLSWKDLTGLEKTRAAASNQAHELEGPFTDIELVQEGKITQGDAETLLEQAGEQPSTRTPDPSEASSR
ncbi:MAG TPA: lysylphosphatidylglycerol synthase transmembrane domain-containing protein [Chloroflexia bacterium]|nr:lysylphosphatidylglycerol synthase transmembrane domain-containing protein [Chloroflexia bacterium]